MTQQCKAQLQRINKLLAMSLIMSLTGCGSGGSGGAENVSMNSDASNSGSGGSSDAVIVSMDNDASNTESGGSGGAKIVSMDSNTGNTGSGSGNTQLGDVPANLISSADSSVVLEAANRGLNLDFNLLQSQFNCYYSHDADNTLLTDYTNQNITVSFTGNTYEINGFGEEAIIGQFIETENANSFTIELPNGDGTRYLIQFDSFGQYFDSSSVPGLTGCFHLGASSERAEHQFLLNKPEAATYSCIVAQGNSIVAENAPLTILDGSRYEYSGMTGSYLYSGIVLNRGSDFLFDSGPLIGLEGKYVEDPNTGRQQLNVSDEALTAGASCSRQRVPRPFKLYGNGFISPPERSSVPLTGTYFLGPASAGAVGWNEVTEDGFMNLEIPETGEFDCRRPHPNGLPACLKYVYNGGNTISIARLNQQADFPITRNTDGGFSTQVIGSYTPVTTPTAEQLAGRWTIETARTQDTIDISNCILGNCSATGVSTELYQFNDDGTFNYSLNSQSIGSSSAGDVSAVFSSASEQTQSGSFDINGPLLQLDYTSGNPDVITYMHLSDSNTLTIGRRTYRREN